jgi:diketogulonate reductase-like aldo/keto reductase
LIKYCQDRNIQVEAMSTFSHFRSNNPRTEILESDAIRPIAEKYGKSIAQVVLRWLVQQNIIVIPKTWFKEHLQENISVFDFSLTDEEMTIIDSMDQGKFLNYNPYNASRGLTCKYKKWNGFKNQVFEDFTL